LPIYRYEDDIVLNFEGVGYGDFSERHEFLLKIESRNEKTGLLIFKVILSILGNTLLKFDIFIYKMHSLRRKKCK